MSVEETAVAFVAATKKRAQARRHLSALRKKWLVDNDTFFDQHGSDGMDGSADMMDALEDRKQANAAYRRAKSHLFRACAAIPVNEGKAGDDGGKGEAIQHPSTRPRSAAGVRVTVTPSKMGMASRELERQMSERNAGEASSDWLDVTMAKVDRYANVKAALARGDEGFTQEQADSSRAKLEAHLTAGVAAVAPARWCPECRSAGVVGIEQDVCPTCNGIGRVAARGVAACETCGGTRTVVTWGGGEQKPCPKCAAGVGSSGEAQEFPYDRTFHAIQAATRIWAGGSGIAISVEAFKKAWAAHGGKACDDTHDTSGQCPAAYGVCPHGSKCNENKHCIAADGGQAAEQLREATRVHGNCKSCHALHPQHHAGCADDVKELDNQTLSASSTGGVESE